jgi:hypothetical protein
MYMYRITGRHAQNEQGRQWDKDPGRTKSMDGAAYDDPLWLIPK